MDAALECPNQRANEKGKNAAEGVAEVRCPGVEYQPDMFLTGDRVVDRYGVDGHSLIAYRVNANLKEAHNYEVHVRIGVGPDRRWWTHWELTRYARGKGNARTVGTQADAPMGPYKTYQRAVRAACSQVRARFRRRVAGVPQELSEFLALIDDNTQRAA